MLKKESRVVPPSNEPCVDSAPESNIEGELPNAVIREELDAETREKYYKYWGKYYVYLSLLQT